MTHLHSHGNMSPSQAVYGRVYSVSDTGGLLLSDATPNLSFGSTTRQMLNLWGNKLRHRCASVHDLFSLRWFLPGLEGFAWYQGGSHDDRRRNAGTGGVELMSLNNAGLTVNGTFVSASDRNKKEHFTAVNRREVLDKVAALPITSWNYKQLTGTRHMGPTALSVAVESKVGGSGQP